MRKFIITKSLERFERWFIKVNYLDVQTYSAQAMEDDFDYWVELGEIKKNWDGKIHFWYYDKHYILKKI